MAFVPAATAVVDTRGALRIGHAALTARPRLRPRAVPAVRACRCTVAGDSTGGGGGGGGSGGSGGDGGAAAGGNDSSHGSATRRPTDVRRDAWRQQAVAFGEALSTAAGRGDVAAALAAVGAAAAEVAGSADVQAAVAEIATELFSAKPSDHKRRTPTSAGGGPQSPPASAGAAAASASAGTARPQWTRTASVAKAAPRRLPQRDRLPQLSSPRGAAAPLEQPLLPPPKQGAGTAQPSPSPPLPDAPAGWAPPAECREMPSSYEWRIELPGVARADVRVSLVLAGRSVWVRGVKPRPAEGAWVGVEAGAPLSAACGSEVVYGAFGRRLPLPRDADVAAAPRGVGASLRDGVLTVTVAKVPPPPDTVVHIQVV